MDLKRDNRQRIHKFWSDKIEITEKLSKTNQYVFPRNRKSLKNQASGYSRDALKSYHSEIQDQSITNIADIYDLHAQNFIENSNYFSNKNDLPQGFQSQTKRISRKNDIQFEDMCRIGLSNILNEWQYHKQEPLRITKLKSSRFTEKNDHQISSKPHRKINIASHSPTTYLSQKSINKLQREPYDLQNKRGLQKNRHKKNIIQIDQSLSREENNRCCCLFSWEEEQSDQKKFKNNENIELQNIEKSEKKYQKTFGKYKSEQLTKDRKIKQIVGGKIISKNMQRRSLSTHLPTNNCNYIQKKLIHEEKHRFPLQKINWATSRSKSLFQKAKQPKIIHQYDETRGATPQTSLNQLKS